MEYLRGISTLTLELRRTRMKRGLTKAEFEQWATNRGWTKDKFGNFHKTANGKEYRFKISKISVRYELKFDGDWLRLRSGYFKDLGFDKEDKLTGLKL